MQWVAIFVVCVISIATAGCSGDDARDDRCSPGDSVACVCDDGARGDALCRSDATLAACACEPGRTLPCSEPGAAFDCHCGDGARGTSICTVRGTYTACACKQSMTHEDDAGRTAVPEPASSSECPSGFSCVEQMGSHVCAGPSRIPPLCSDASDCKAAGLTRADCVRPATAAVQVCVLFCQD